MLTVNAPIALVIAGFAIAAAVAAHLLSVQQPRMWTLPTARFVRDSTAMAVARANRPRDLLLLLLRALVLGALGAAFAGVSCAARRSPVAAVVVVDGMDIQGFLEQARQVVLRDSALRALPVRRLVVAGGGVQSPRSSADPVVSVLPIEASLDAALAAARDTIPRADGEPPGLASLLLAARRAAVEVAADADSVVLVVLSPLRDDALSDALPAVRRVWPGAVLVPDIRGALGDSAATDTYQQPTIVWPDSSVQRRDEARGVEGDVRAVVAQGMAVVAPFVVADSGVLFPEGTHRSDTMGRAGGTPRVLAWWHDGTPAIVEHATGSGCERRVGFRPPTGDVLGSDAARGVRHVLSAPCHTTNMRRGANADFTLRQSAYPDSLRALLRHDDSASMRAVPSTLLTGRDRSGTPITRWLLVAAVLLLVAEWAVRRATPVTPSAVTGA